MRMLWIAAMIALAAGANAEDSAVEPAEGLPPNALRRLGGTAGVHPDDIADMAVSPDGKWVATACRDDHVRVWRLEDFEVRRNLDSGTLGSDFVCWTSDNRVAFARENAIVICSPESGEEDSLYGPDAQLERAAFSPDGKYLAAGTDDGRIFIWNPGTGKFLRKFDAREAEERRHFEALVWSPDSRSIWTVAEKGQVRSWNAQTGAKGIELDGSIPGIGGIAISPDRVSLVTANHETDEVAFWDLASGKLTRALRIERLSYGSRPCLSADGATLAACVIDNVQGIIEVWSVREARRLLRIPAPGHDPDWTQFLPDGKRLVSAGGDDHRLRVWDVATGAELTPGTGHRDKVLGIRPLDGGRGVVTAGADGRILVWPAASGVPPLRTLSSGIRPRAAVLSGDGTRVWLGGDHGDIELWDLAAGRKLAEAKGDGKAIECLAVSHDGTKLAVSRWEPNLVGVRNADLTGEVRLFEPTTRVAQPIIFAPDEEWLVTAGTDAVRIRASESGEAWAEWNLKTYTHSIALSPDGALLAVAAMDSLVVVEIATGEVVNESKRDSLVSAIVAFSADGADLYLGSRDGDVEVIDIRDWKRRLLLKGHAGDVTALAAGYTKDIVYSGGADGCVIEWKLPPRRPADPLPALLADASPWSALDGLKAPEAFALIERCRAASEASMEELAAKLSEFPGSDPAIPELLKHLDSEDPAARRTAVTRLRQLGDAAEGALRDAARTESSAEAKAAIAATLGLLATPLQHSPEMLRRARAIRLLERHGGPKARAALRMLSEKSPFTRERRLAAAACRRLAGGE